MTRGTLLRLALLTLCCLRGESRAVAQFPYADYHPTTLTREIKAYPHDPRADFWTEHADLRYRVRVTVPGKSRPLTPLVGKVLDRWVRANGHGPSIRAVFLHEILVLEAKTEYWLPVQEPLRQPLANEVRRAERLIFSS
jgi:hypothetical protein